MPTPPSKKPTKRAAKPRGTVKRARTLRGEFREAYARYLNNWSMGYEADNCVNAAIKAAEAAAVAEERDRCAKAVAFRLGITKVTCIKEELRRILAEIRKATPDAK